MMATPATQEIDVVYVGFLTGHGGDALQMLGLAKGMKNLGAHVRIVVPALPSSLAFKERCHALGVDCERSDLITADTRGARQALGSILRLFVRLKAPIVHFHSGNSCLPRTAQLGLEILRHPAAFVTLQSPFETIVPGSIRARLWAASARRRFKAVVSPSEHATHFQRLCGVPPSLAVTIRNGIDTEAMRRGDGRAPRSLLGVGTAEPVILFSSRMDRQKRPVDAVHVFSRVAQEFPTAILVFVGGGGQEEAVREEAASLGLSRRVRLVGYRTDIPNWLAAATVWLLPTERENFSVAVLEALAAGCPVLATSCPGNDEILTNEGNALTFGVGDLEAAAQGLRRLLLDPSLREALGRRAQATARDYAVERMVEEYQLLYRRHRCAGSRPQP